MARRALAHRRYSLARSGLIFSQDRYLLFMAPFFCCCSRHRRTRQAALRRRFGRLDRAVALRALALALPVLWTPATARRKPASRRRLHPRLPAGKSKPACRSRDPRRLHARFPWSGICARKPRSTTCPSSPSAERSTRTRRRRSSAPPLLGIVEFGAHTLWLTQSHLEGVDDKLRLVEQWLAQRFPSSPSSIRGHQTQRLHAAIPLRRPAPVLGPHAACPAAELAPGVTLAACEITTQPAR